MDNRKREIVLGIHDFIPPEGRITVEVRDDLTGKLVQKECADNDVMDWFLLYIKQCFQWGRSYGSGRSVTPHYMGDLATIADPLADTATRLTQVSTNGLIAPVANLLPLNDLSQIFLSDNTSAISSSSRWVPGSVVGVSATRGGTSYQNNKVGQVDYNGCILNYNSHTWKYSFLPSKANGTFQTLGYGVFIWDRSTSSNTNEVYPYVSAPFDTANLGTGFDGTEAPLSYGSTFFSPSSSANDRAYDVTHATQHFVKNIVSSPFSLEVRSAGYGSGSVLYTVTNANLGNINTTWQDFCVVGNNLWFLSGTNAWRYYAIPISSNTPSVVASGTFSGFTDTGVISCCSNGTNIYILGGTKVWVFNPSTQSITTSWSHGVDLSSVTSSQGAKISWSAEDSALVISCRNGVNMRPRAVTGSSYGLMSVSKFFDTSGNSLNITIGLEGADYSTEWGTISDGLITGWMPDGSLVRQFKTGFSSSPYYIGGPNMRSAVLLDNPVTKTDSQTMTISYEIAFS